MIKLLPALSVLFLSASFAALTQETTVTYRTIFADKEISLTEKVPYWRYLKIKIQEL